MIIKKTSPNFTKGREDKKITGIVILLYKSARFWVPLPIAVFPRFVNSIVLGYGYYFKVFRSIIKFIAVYVMGSLVSRKFSPKFLLKNHTVHKFPRILMSGVIPLVSPRINVNAAFPIKMLLPFFRGAFRKGFPVTIYASMCAFVVGFTATVKTFTISTHNYIVL